jgi:hypothetical protein
MSTFNVGFKDGKYTATRFDFWLVFDKEGPMRLTRKAGKLSRNERALFVQATLPQSLWETPTLKASIVVADPGSAQRSVDVAAAAEAVRQAIGLDIDLQVKQPEASQ